MYAMACPTCGHQVSYRPEQAGATAKCERCGEAIRLSKKPAAEAVAKTKSDQHAAKTGGRSLQQTVALWLITGILAVHSVASLAGWSAARWEYKIVNPADTDFERDMNALGADGWELVTARRATVSGSEFGVHYECLLKRRR